MEEVVFRGLLMPAFNWRWAVVSTTLYVLWHPIEAYTFLPAADPLFRQPVFLGLVTVGGTLWICLLENGFFVDWRTPSLVGSGCLEGAGRSGIYCLRDCMQSTFVEELLAELGH